MSMKVTKTSPLNYHYEFDGGHAKLLMVVVCLACFAAGYVFGAL